jgi:triacylglycerol lipase
MEPLAKRFVQSGWPAQAVSIVRFNDPFGSNIDHASEIARAVDDVSTRAAQPVVAIAHSMGGLALRWYLAHNHNAPVAIAVFLATPHRGTWLAWLARGRGGAEMRPRSQFLTDLNATSVSPHTRLISFRAPFDTRIFPSSSAWLDTTDRANTRTLPAHGHKRILEQQRVFDEIVKIIHER